MYFLLGTIILSFVKYLDDDLPDIQYPKYYYDIPLLFQINLENYFKSTHNWCSNRKPKGKDTRLEPLYVNERKAGETNKSTFEFSMLNITGINNFTINNRFDHMEIFITMC